MVGKTVSLLNRALGKGWQPGSQGIGWAGSFNVDEFTGGIWKYTPGENLPPGAPDIDGPASGDVGTSYDYDFTSTDPDDDQVKYYIDWGDGETDETSLAASGTPVTVSHTWTIGGDLVITAYAEDENGAAGPEETLPIFMPRNRAHVHTFLQWVLERFPNAFPIFRCVFGL